MTIEPGSPDQIIEQTIDMIVRDIRDLPIKDRLRAILFVMDELCAVTREHNSEIDRYTAGQIITRTQLAAGFLFERAQANKVIYLR